MGSEKMPSAPIVITLIVTICLEPMLSKRLIGKMLTGSHQELYSLWFTSSHSLNSHQCPIKTESFLVVALYTVIKLLDLALS